MPATPGLSRRHKNRIQSKGKVMCGGLRCSFQATAAVALLVGSILCIAWYADVIARTPDLYSRRAEHDGVVGGAGGLEFAPLEVLGVRMGKRTSRDASRRAGNRAIRNGLIRRDEVVFRGREDAMDISIATPRVSKHRNFREGRDFLPLVVHLDSRGRPRRTVDWDRWEAYRKEDRWKTVDDNPFQDGMGNERNDASHESHNDASVVDFNYQLEDWQEKCVPMKEWQTTFHPTCNSVHEVDLSGISNGFDAVLISAEEGSWRMAWKVAPWSEEEAEGQTVSSQRERRTDEERARRLKATEEKKRDKKRKKRDNEDSVSGKIDHAFEGDDEEVKTVVLKMLRLDREFNAESFHYNIVDSIAMERLAFSPHVMDEYGFCGESVMTELADGDGRSLIKDSKVTNKERMQIGLNLSQGMADIHGIDYANGKNATFAHNDINFANIVQVGGRIKYNDFNIGMPLRWNARENKPCGFPVMFESPLWRSPEEVRNESYVSEKADVYSLGNILYQVLTKHQPWTWLEPGGRPSLQNITAQKKKGGLPFFPDKYTDKSEKMTVHAQYIAILMCYTNDPKRRPTAQKIATGLDRAIKLVANDKELKFEELRKVFGWKD